MSDREIYLNLKQGTLVVLRKLADLAGENEINVGVVDEMTFPNRPGTLLQALKHIGEKSEGSSLEDPLILVEDDVFALARFADTDQLKHHSIVRSMGFDLSEQRDVERALKDFLDVASPKLAKE